MAFNDTISTLSGSSTFYDWFIKENNEIISKLNQVTVSGVTSGDGVLASTNVSSGLVTVSIGGTSGNITTGLTFSGKVSFLGETAVPNVSYKITGITSGTSGYTFGTVVRITPTGYTWAIANDADSAEVVGIISAKNPTYSVVTLSGKIEGDFSTTLAAGSTLSAGCVYFLDPTTPGKITVTEPSTVGQVSKPVIIGIGQTAGMVVQYRGNYLNAASGGESGTNRLYITFSTSGSPDPRSYGFTGGKFLSYAPDLLTGNTYFVQYLVDTGRTAINGWFLSGSKNYAYRLYDFGSPYLNIPWEEDYIVGMVENVSAAGSDVIYQIIARGTSPTIPGSIDASASKQGAWCISGATFNPLGTTGQLVKFPTNNNEPYSPVYQAGFVFSASPSSWYVNPRPLAKGPDVQQRSTQQAEELTNSTNYAFNGDFSVWQRRDVGVGNALTSTSNVYFADNWIRRVSGITGQVSLQLQYFAATEVDVEGPPEYYVRLKALTDPSPNTAPTNSVYSIGHVIENSESFSDSPITVSFYARCTNINYGLNVYLAKYADNGSGTNQLISKTTIGTVNFSNTNWNKHTINYTVPAHAGTTYTNDYLEIGVDLNPLINTAYTANVAASTALYVDVASFNVYSGTYVAPPHTFKPYNEKLKLAQKYYFRTYYSDSQTTGSVTMTNSTVPTLNTFSFVHLPNTAWGVYNLPVEMRTTPSVLVRSPYLTTPSYNEMYNYTAVKDLREAAGSVGYNGAVRSGGAGSATVTTSADKSTVRVNLQYGSVPFDVVYGHIVADASYPI